MASTHNAESEGVGVLRALGRSFPTTNPPRFRIQLAPKTSRKRTHAAMEESDMRSTRYVCSLVDVANLARSSCPASIVTRATMHAWKEHQQERTARRQAKKEEKAPVTSDKIEALESELARLREMIASVIVSSNTAPSTPAPPYSRIYSAAGACVPPPPPPPLPFLLPAAITGGDGGSGGGGAAAGMGGPPPPPPPPPPPSLFATPTTNVIELIKQNKKNAAKDGPKKEVPNMADVLKNIGTVKLKTVDRSPGGTPARRQPVAQKPLDHISLINLALKRKFANHHGDDKPPSKADDIENALLSKKPRITPEKSAGFGPHMLRKAPRPALSPVTTN